MGPLRGLRLRGSSDCHAPKRNGIACWYVMEDVVVDLIQLVFLHVFTARCYAERGYATIRRLSVRLSVYLSVTLRYVFHTGWNTSKKITAE